MIDPFSNKTTGYHLFLEPTGTGALEIASLMQVLSEQYGGPVYAPHVTLLSHIPAGDEESIITKAQTLAESFSPFTLSLGELDTEHTYFKAVYLHVREQEMMQRLHARACGIFSIPCDEDYAPHLSLLYGTYSHEQIEKILHTLEYPQNMSFQVDRIHLYQTEGTVDEWKKIQEFLLKD